MIHLETARGGAGWRQPPPKGQHNQSRGVPPHQTLKGVWAERWEDALKQDTATSPGRSLKSAGSAALAGGDTLTATHFGKNCAVQNVIALLRGESLPFSPALPHSGLSPLVPPARLIWERFEFTHSHLSSCPHQHCIRSTPFPLRGLTSKRGFWNSSSSISTLGKTTFQHHFQLMLYKQSIHPLNSGKSLLHLRLR